ncbi:uncharacterized protein PHACADRAFT_106988, partial [Phanerochaete carnosa HHB-10118-sp]
KDARYFKDKFFNASKKHLSENKIDSYNAWLHFKCRDVNQREYSPSYEYLAEYHALSDEEKTKCVYDYELVHEFKKHVRRTTSRGKIQDFSHTAAILEEIILDLDNRIGVKGFFCLVRSTTDFATEPQWWFSSADLERFLSVGWRKRWDSKQIGTMVEAFAIAGGSLLTLVRPADITGNTSAGMEYVNYETQIIQRYGVVLVGWPKDLPFVNPNDLTNNLTTLELLLQALNNGTCHFIRPTDAELSQRKAAWLAGVANGTVEAPKQRKKRSDAGKPRGSHNTATGKQKAPESVAPGSGSSDGEESESSSENETEGVARAQKRKRA